MGETIFTEEKTLQRITYRNDALKILAMVTMFIDHIGYMLFPNQLIYRTIGRLAFPIFAYQIAIGYSKTSSLKNYIKRLLIFALISQLPYSFFNPELKFNPLHFNVLFMFIAAIGVVYIYDLGVFKIKSFIENKKPVNLILGTGFFLLTLVLIILPEAIGFYVKEFSFEYGFLGLAMVLVFHIFRENDIGALIGVILLYLLHGYYWAALFNSRGVLAQFFSNIVNFKFIWKLINYNNGLLNITGYYFNARGVFALIPIFLIKGMDTSSIRINKYIAYIFYPAHITLLVIIKVILLLFSR